MTTQIPEFRWDCRPIRNHLCVESFLLIAGRRARQWIVPVQVGAPRGQRLSGMRDRLPDDFDFDSEIEVLPGAVRGEGRGLALYGEGEAGAVAQRQAEGLRDLHQTSCNPCLIFVKGCRFALELGDVPPLSLIHI